MLPHGLASLCIDMHDLITDRRDIADFDVAAGNFDFD